MAAFYEKPAKKVKEAASRAGDAASSVLRMPGVDYLINPLVAQDIAGAAFAGSLSRGADGRTALSNAGGASADLASGVSGTQWADLAAFNAALIAGAATGGAAGGAFVSPAGTLYGASGGAALAGAGAGGAAYLGTNQIAQNQSGDYTGSLSRRSSAEAPPDVNEANDPNSAAQFTRLRKAARSLGRAGTFKNKGTGTSLGLGDSVLGDQLSLIGS